MQHLIVLILALCFTECGSLDTHAYCHPAICSDGSCYCTDRRDGWINGGFGCSKNGNGCECTCDDAATSCKNKRCPDTWTEEIQWHGYSPIGVRCVFNDPVRGAIYSGREDRDFCYRTTVLCNYGKCAYGESLIGCGRTSSGACQKCPELAANKYWASKSNCAQNACSPVTSGEFAAKPCTSTTDTVRANCSTHSGNAGHIFPRQDGKSTYYCPGNGLVLPLPDNSEPNSDYSNFICIDGYYLNGASCLPCVTGSACKYGRSYVCPMHYYTSTFAKSACTLCASQCPEWSYPVRCAQGSTANMGCVPCGGCSYDSKRGLSCVTESYEMQGLPDSCVPANVEGEVAVCIMR